MAGQSIHYAGSLAMNVLDVCGLQCASFGQWQAADGDAITIANPRDFVYRSLHWTGDRVTGALFVGRADHVGMLTDVGMVKGLIQTGVPLGPWKEFLRENPFDVRRAFVACDVPRRLRDETLLGVPAAPRGFRHDETLPQAPTHRTTIAARTAECAREVDARKLQCRCHPGDECGRNGENGGKGEHGDVERHIARAYHVRRHDREHCAQTCLRDEHTPHGARAAEQQCFEEQAPRDTPATGTERSLRRHFGAVSDFAFAPHR